MFSIRRAWIPLAAVALALTAVPVQAAESQFSAKLTGTSQLPEPTTSKATGELKLVISADDKKISYTLSVENISNANGADMHLGPDTANGPAVVKLFPVHGASAEERRLQRRARGGHHHGGRPHGPVARVHTGGPDRADQG